MNQIRLRKRMMHPFELVGIRGRSQTLKFRKIDATSCVYWKNSVVEVPKPSKKSADMWTDFINWLCQQKIETTVDFAQIIQCRCEMSMTKRRVKKLKIIK